MGDRIKLFLIFLFSCIAFASATASSSDVCNANNDIRNNNLTLLTVANRVFIIKEEIDLKGQTIELGSNSTLLFKGGILKNGHIVGDKSKIKCKLEKCFDSCSFSGSWNVKQAFPEWFGACNNGIIDCTKPIQAMFDFMEQTDTYKCRFKRCNFREGEYYLISKTIYIRKPVKIDGGKAFISSKSLITWKDDPNHPSYKNNGIALHFVRDKSKSPKLTDICINVKVHAKPFFFSQMTNVIVHDCYVSTYTGETNITEGVFTYWFAFQCDELTHATFRNVHIDQPTKPINNTDYNSSDGIHLSGGCHDILIDNVYGQAGDDFIAMNTNENHSGDIYNIEIKNCDIGMKEESVSGIRFYGCSRLSHAEGKPQLQIRNVSIKNCRIKTSASPCIFFTNNPVWKKYDPASKRLYGNNIVIKDCKLLTQSKCDNRIAIWLGGLECDNIRFENVKTIDINQENVHFLGVSGLNDLKLLTINNCNQGNLGFYKVVVQDVEMLEKNSKVNRKELMEISPQVFVVNSKHRTTKILNGMITY